MTDVKWTKLDSGDFGIAGNGRPPARGEVVVAVSRDGRRTRVAVDRVKTANGTHWRASILRDGGRLLQLEAP